MKWIFYEFVKGDVHSYRLQNKEMEKPLSSFSPSELGRICAKEKFDINLDEIKMPSFAGEVFDGGKRWMVHGGHLEDFKVSYENMKKYE